MGKIYNENYKEPEILINPEGVSFEQLISLNGKVVKFIPNGNRYEPDGRKIPMIGIVNIIGNLNDNSADGKVLILEIRCQNNMGHPGGVYSRTGAQVPQFLKGVYSIEEVTDITSMTFSEKLD